MCRVRGKYVPSHLSLPIAVSILWWWWWLRVQSLPFVSSSFVQQQLPSVSITTFVRSSRIQQPIPIPSRDSRTGYLFRSHRHERRRRCYDSNTLGCSLRQASRRNGDDDNNMDYDASIFDEIGSFDPYNNKVEKDDDEDIESDVLEEMEFLRSELVHLESLEDMIQELEKYSIDESPFDYNDDDNEDDIDTDMESLWDEDSLDELLNNLPPTEDNHEAATGTTLGTTSSKAVTTTSSKVSSPNQFYTNLEQVLLQGVVPVQADVGSECLVGDFGFDPLHLSDVDLFRPTQQFLLQLLPSSSSIYEVTSEINNTRNEVDVKTDEGELQQRPRALILRDYREAEIRHGRLAMLAAMIWPLQEMVDKFILSKEQFGPLIYGPVTLPYFPLLMTAIMLLLGYLDIYSQAIKDMDQIGDAFLPGDCFWDPLQVLQGAPDEMRRNMQERELFNGRSAMIAVVAYIVEESVTHKALIDIGSNNLLLQPAYEIPFIQEWLDNEFSLSLPTAGMNSDLVPISEDNSSMLLDTLNTLVQSTMILLHLFQL